MAGEDIMAIKNILIDNYKSIKHCELQFKDINLLIGENGSGKTNILSAIKYFYNNLVGSKEELDAFDHNNKFSNCIRISITFDFTTLNIRSYSQLKKEDTQYHNYYKKITQASRNNELTVELMKVKDKNIKWNCDISIRKMISNLFPLYIIDCRSMDLINWMNIWQEIGDLIKLESNLERNLKEQIDEIIDDESYKLRDTFSELSNILTEEKIKVKGYTPKQYASNLATLVFEGNEFEFKENKLNLFSNGTNASNYIRIFMRILGVIARKKMKCPIVILDEPEISLHHRLIDKMTDEIESAENDVQTIMSTHSPRLLKNILRGQEDKCAIFHMKLEKSYTVVSEVKLFQQNSRHKIIITDQHANAYFSNSILMVEGESELEVFNNRYLREIFRCIKRLDVMQGTSNDIVNQIISPLHRKYSVPVVLLRDMCLWHNKNAESCSVKMHI